MLTREPIRERKGAERRRGGRVLCEMISCELGKVIDLSATGLRVKSRGGIKPPVGAFVALHVRWCGGSARLPARVTRIQRHGMFSWEFGLAFEELSPEHRSLLSDILRGAAIRRHIGPDLTARRSA